MYDWWDLALAWGSSNPPMLKKPIGEIGAEEDSAICTWAIEEEEEHSKCSPQTKWVHKLMIEMGVLALPCEIELLGCALDSRDFWNEFNLSPIQA